MVFASVKMLDTNSVRNTPIMWDFPFLSPQSPKSAFKNKWIHCQPKGLTDLK